MLEERKVVGYENNGNKSKELSFLSSRDIL